jgi:very-short-patch-repair endonuclease
MARAFVRVAGLRALSEGEETLALQVRALRLPDPAREYAFSPARLFRFDFAWPGFKLAVEVEGGTSFGRSRHSAGIGFETDCDKYNLAALEGWRVLRFSTRQVKDGRAIATVERAFSILGVSRG